MDATSGIFTAPRDGIYSFHFSGVAYYPQSERRSDVVLSLFLNGYAVGSSDTDIGPSTHLSYHTHSLHSTLELKTGDQVWLSIGVLPTGGFLFDNTSHYTHFTGHLLQEKYDGKSL